MILATCVLSLASAVTVELPMESFAGGTEIEVHEVAVVSGADAEAVALIESIELGYAPAPGYSRLLHADRIQLLLERKAPHIKVRMIGQRATRVWPEVEEIAKSEVEAIALAELRRTYQTADATFRLAATLPTIVVPASASSHSLRATVDERKLASGTISVPVEVIVDGATYRTVWTSWKSEVYETLPVLKQPVKAGEVMSPEMFERRRVRRMSGARAKPLASIQLLGAVAARDLAPGSVVVGTDVHRPALVTKGDTIFLCVKKGGITARVSAVALSTGAAGDRIRVRATGTNQDLTAVITSRDVAEIDLGR